VAAAVAAAVTVEDVAQQAAAPGPLRCRNFGLDPGHLTAGTFSSRIKLHWRGTDRRVDATGAPGDGRALRAFRLAHKRVILFARLPQAFSKARILGGAVVFRIAWYVAAAQ